MARKVAKQMKDSNSCIQLVDHRNIWSQLATRLINQNPI